MKVTGTPDCSIVGKVALIIAEDPAATFSDDGFTAITGAPFCNDQVTIFPEYALGRPPADAVICEVDP